jgi:hypothetical protein
VQQVLRGGHDVRRILPHPVRKCKQFLKWSTPCELTIIHYLLVRLGILIVGLFVQTCFVLKALAVFNFPGSKSLSSTYVACFVLKALVLCKWLC